MQFDLEGCDDDSLGATRSSESLNAHLDDLLLSDSESHYITDTLPLSTAIQPHTASEDALSSSHVVPIHAFTFVDAPPSPQISLTSFDLLSVIGKGAYGKVYLVRKRPCPTSTLSSSTPDPPPIYAMKVLRKAHILLHEPTTRHTHSERSILEAVQHPFIVKLYYAFQTSHKLYLILQYAPGGELFTHLAHQRMFSESVAAFYTAELLLALEHLHGIY